MYRRAWVDAYELSGEAAESNMDPEEEYVSAPDYINVYPFCNFMADKFAIENFLKAYFNTSDIEFYPMVSRDNCFRWNVLTHEHEYVLLQPFSHINRSVFYPDGDRYEDVCRASNRFQIHAHWACKVASSTLYTDTANQLILSAASPFLDCDRDLPDIIQYIQTNRSANSYDEIALAEQIDLMLKNSTPTTQIQEQYETYMDRLVLFSKGDFSCCLECRKLLDIIQKDASLKKLLGEKIPACFAGICRMDESGRTYVLSGFVSDFPSFLRRENKVVVGDCEYLHLAHPGEDYAKLLNKLSGNAKDIGIWKANLERFPENERAYTLLWSIILLAKKALLQYNMAQATEDIEVTVIQLNQLAALWDEDRLS